MFRRASELIDGERDLRLSTKERLLTFGIDCLDDALLGIWPDDLILLGAPSGVGKTQLCCNIALANIEDGKRVHYIALEASELEIERRMKFNLVAERYYADKPGTKIDFQNWLAGEYGLSLDEYEQSADDFFKKGYGNFFLFNRLEKFGVSELVESIYYAADETDLIIIDHVHYFDFDDDNENRAMKEVAKTARHLALDVQKPIILVAHMRKRDRSNNSLVADMDEFHGSSDLSKIATKIITFAPGNSTDKGSYETFFRIPKSRINGGVTRFSMRELFNPKTGGYEHGVYKVGWANQNKTTGFQELDRSLYPSWAKRSYSTDSGHGLDVPQRASGVSGQSLYRNKEKMYWLDKGD